MFCLEKLLQVLSCKHPIHPHLFTLMTYDEWWDRFSWISLDNLRWELEPHFADNLFCLTPHDIHRLSSISGMC